MTTTINDLITQHDSAGMLKLIMEFPAQSRAAIDIGESARIAAPAGTVNQVILAGMGGSAIGGNILQDLMQASAGVPCTVLRDYVLPPSADERTLVFLCSYSGNTEETLSVFAAARQRGCMIMICTSGGQLLENARHDQLPAIVIPGGQPPRSALGYLFFPLLMHFVAWDWIDRSLLDLDELLDLLQQIAADNAPDQDPMPRARAVAEACSGRIPIVYSSQGLQTVGRRWCGQICENSKSLAFHNVLPEMNHNEIIGWQRHGQMALDERFVVIFLRDRGDHPRVQKRLEIVQHLISETGTPWMEIDSRGEAPLSRVFSLIYLGDFVSFYLAMLNQEDPTPIINIDYLKSELAQ